ncbi:hypothetical protein DNTS_025472 [Danionella cerebrum]|uniref:DUF4772 domain-containing protein n=1 Tax=Danionella cerebrum TaxID=2873325 RepID=A0A553Q3B1_9TELE|nr:hypothetical protein DNTS_025472 [Danionella translucida]
MHTRRMVKRTVIGSRVYAPGITGDAAQLIGVIQAVKQDNRDASTGHRRNVYTVLMQDGGLKEYSEEEIAQMTAKVPLKSSLKPFSALAFSQVNGYSPITADNLRHSKLIVYSPFSQAYLVKNTCNGGQRDGQPQGQNGGVQRVDGPSQSPESTEEPRLLEHKRTGRALESEKDHTRSVSLLEQKRKVVSSSIDVPQTSALDNSKDVVH